MEISHPILDSKKEMMWIGGGAGMAPLSTDNVYDQDIESVRIG